MIADADPSMKVMQEETFGPVIPVMKVSDAEEAVRLANDTTYGLGATVFAGDPNEGERVARRVEAGACDVNDVLAHYNVLEIPMGGWKHSGIGYAARPRAGSASTAAASRSPCPACPRRSRSCSGTPTRRASAA